MTTRTRRQEPNEGGDHDDAQQPRKNHAMTFMAWIRRVKIVQLLPRMYCRRITVLAPGETRGVDAESASRPHALAPRSGPHHASSPHPYISDLLRQAARTLRGGAAREHFPRVKG
jgi:hypothetical protein